MPKFKYELTNGKFLTLEGDSQPDDKEVENIAKEQGVTLKGAEDVTSPSPTNPIPTSTPNTIPSMESTNTENESAAPEESVISQSVPQEEGLLHSLWRKASEPITNLPSRFAKSIADYIDTPHLDTSVPMAMVKGGIAGAIQGAGDLLSGLTSPINLATTALGGGELLAGKTGLEGAANLMNIGQRVMGAPMAIEGAQTLFDKNKPLNERLMGIPEIAGGIAAVAHAPSTKTPEPELKVPGVVTEATDKYKPYRDMPVGAEVVIKNNKLKQNLVQEATNLGFVFDRTDDNGHFVFKKMTDSPPITETQVGNNRARLGPEVNRGRESKAADLVNLPRTIMASYDMSGPLRQGLPLIHRKEFWQAIPEMFRAWGSENAFNAIQQSIEDRPLFKPREFTDPKTGKKVTKPSLAQDLGLYLTDIADLSNREEAFASKLAEKIPGVRSSERAYVAFLNKLRADTFESLMKHNKVINPAGELDTVTGRALADFINTTTGRGSLKFDARLGGHGKVIDLEKSAGLLNNTLFAPRLIASRVKMLDPRFYLMGNPAVRAEAWKTLFGTVGVGSTLGQLARLSGLGTVESDPTSSDFGKIRIGNIRLDPFGGFQQYGVLASRLAQGKIKSSTTGNSYNLGEKFGRPTRFDIAERFAESKLNPILSFVTDWLHGKDLTGKPFNLSNEMISRLTPIMVQDLTTLLSENPDLVPGIKDIAKGNVHPENLPAAIPAWFGMGMQNYASRPNRP